MIESHQGVLDRIDRIDDGLDAMVLDRMVHGFERAAMPDRNT